MTQNNGIFISKETAKEALSALEYINGLGPYHATLMAQYELHEKLYPRSVEVGSPAWFEKNAEELRKYFGVKDDQLSISE